MKILLAGYEPLFGDTINPSIESVKAVVNKGVPGFTLHAVEIPLNFRLIGPIICQAIDEFCPDVVICTGLASNRPAISLERVAVNVVSGTDHLDLTLVEERIIADGPPAYMCDLPLLKMRDVLLSNGIPAHISDSAGTHGCNYIFYYAAHHLARTLPNSKVAFIHMPRLPEQVARLPKPEQYASMSLSLDIEALCLIIGEIVE